MEQAGQVIEQSAAHGRHLPVRAALQQRVDGIGPHPEGRTHPERVSTREHAGRFRVAGEQFPAQPALAHPGLTGQQDDAELPRRGPGELILQRGHLIAAAHQRQLGSWHQPDSGPGPGPEQDAGPLDGAQPGGKNLFGRTRS